MPPALDLVQGGTRGYTRTGCNIGLAISDPWRSGMSDGEPALDWWRTSLTVGGDAYEGACVGNSEETSDKE
jgi:hypothetical protein